MKTNHISANMLFTTAILVWVGMGCVSAQNTSDTTTITGQTVIALSQDGTVFKAPAGLRVGVHALQAAAPKFLIGLENESGGYVTIRLKDSLGKNVHRPIFFYRKSLVATFDMSHVEAGTYIVEVANQSERYRYQLQVGRKVVSSVEVRPTVIAKVKQ